MNAATVKKTRKKVEKRICWTTRERTVLLAYITSKLVELYAKVPPMDKLHKVIYDLAMEAQEAKLSADRRRKLIGFTSFHWGDGFEDAYDAALQKALEARDAVKVPAVPPAAEKAVAGPAGGFLESLADEMLATKKWRTLEEQLSETLFRKLKVRVEEKAFGKLEVELGLKPAASQKAIVVQERPQGDEFPVIVLAGWEVPEFEKLREEVAGRATLKHVPLGSTIDEFAACKTAACTLVPANMKSTQFIGKVRATTDRWEKVDNNLKSLRKVLELKLAG